MTHPTGVTAATLPETARKAVIEAVHREHAPSTWRDLCTWERAQVTHEDVLQRLGVADDEELCAVLSQDKPGESLYTDYEMERLVHGIKDEIAVERAQAKLPLELWRRANQDVQ